MLHNWRLADAQLHMSYCEALDECQIWLILLTIPILGSSNHSHPGIMEPFQSWDQVTIPILGSSNHSNVWSSNRSNLPASNSYNNFKVIQRIDACVKNTST